MAQIKREDEDFRDFNSDSYFKRALFAEKHVEELRATVDLQHETILGMKKTIDEYSLPDSQRIKNLQTENGLLLKQKLKIRDKYHDSLNDVALLKDVNTRAMKDNARYKKLLMEMHKASDMGGDFEEWLTDMENQIEEYYKN